MFGKEYSKHLEILIQSFADIGNQYSEKTKEKNNAFIKMLKKMYILLFGIPEIGFQIRSLYFWKIISQYLPKKNLKAILDAGSGIGAYTFWLAKIFPRAKITGMDIDELKLRSARIMSKELRINSVKFTNLNIVNIKNKIKYDFIVSIDVLEHVKNFHTVLKNFCKILNKGGFLYVHVPQPNQKRIFNLFKNWNHKGHAREGIAKADLEMFLKELNFEVITSKETFGFFGKLAWELNHFTLGKGFVLVGIFYPILWIIARIDLFCNNTQGLGIAILARKN